MVREDYDILADLHDTIVQMEQLAGTARHGVKTSSAMTRRLTEFSRKCKDGGIKGRKRKQEANEIFRDLMRRLKRR